ncbi:MAG: SMC-Scp complex subunit ScpB [Candidatus Harrisonbacteria bacterium CG10_big_fil_rev_8_21_14_0_10_45_28]|uniref:SMC-Scp complex subunit ScpB n=1 Tax=Candidatus Harrisonbacteria bacterium CG10_big_fil_rev_8_21_14_0_10_45_28 TaxID=1974586 RepID=A0A2H0UP61_9BACT|nr:MAG: SMC-Scp complex subunit ScpB [Candidatus Harrisonbacteria bacterium CG10_big_fil_rev_8_21_14_0_10_45_28]
MGIFSDNKPKEMHFVSDDLTAGLEALLFLYGDPIEIKKAADFLKTSEAKVRRAGEDLKQALDISGRGLTVVFHNDKIQLTTRADFGGMLDGLVKADLHDALTPAALETLAIVAYGAPISRMEVDFIRGVNSSFILRQLLLRGLIEREVDPKRANAYVYSTTVDFVKHLGITRIEELPEYNRLRQTAHSIRQAQEEEAGEQPSEESSED